MMQGVPGRAEVHAVPWCRVGVPRVASGDPVYGSPGPAYGGPGLETGILGSWARDRVIRLALGSLRVLRLGPDGSLRVLRLGPDGS